MEAKEIETLVGELETRVDRLRGLYEQYFIGFEKVIPSVPQKDVERRIYALRKEHIRNTAVRFRFQMLIQRYNTYQTHWQRICRQIEEGTYKRDVMRAQRRFKNPVAEAPESVPPPSVDVTFSEPPPPAPPEAPPAPPHTDLELEDLGPLPVGPAIVKPALPPRPVWRKKGDPPPKKPEPVAPPPAAVVAKPPPPLPKRDPPTVAPKLPIPPAIPPRSPADLSDDRVRQIYSQYVQTRRSQNESTAAITYDALAKSLRESSAKLREKHGKAVDFEVAVKDGKTILKPVVKR